MRRDGAGRARGVRPPAPFARPRAPAAPICCGAWSRRPGWRSRSCACGSSCAISSTRSPRHAQHELGSDAGPRETLDGALAEIAIAIRELRELARGLRPAQLDAGLGPALHELAGRVALPVAVDATAERFPDVVDTAAYFIACEGLTNATKHAHASKVSLSAQRRNGSLVVCVADDGIGGAAPTEGSGLSGLLDRVGAHGGTLRIESDHGSGTRLVAELPCES